MNSTIKVGKTFGRTSLNKICNVFSVRNFAAATYSSSDSPSTAARTVRATFGVKMKPIIKIVIIGDD